MNNTNPSATEIFEWAYSDSPWPVEEWDLFLSWTQEIELFIELATAHACPRRIFFLHMLYYTVGSTMSATRRDGSVARILWYASKGRNVTHGDVKTWVRNVDALVKGGIPYRYKDWRAGRLAGYDLVNDQPLSKSISRTNPP